MAVRTKASITMSLEGYDDFVRKLRAVGSSVPGELENIVTEESEPLREEVARNAPEGETKTLKRGIGLKVTISDVRGVSLIIGPTEEAWYGKFLELGTKFIAARPWMVPAFERHRDRIKLGIKNRIAELIKRVISQ